jgi:hypothetical protein
MTRKLENGIYLDEVGEGWLSLGGDGSGLSALNECPVAQRNAPTRKDKVDASHLSRYTNTDLVQWRGRKADGMFWPIGRILKLTPKGKALLRKEK